MTPELEHIGKMLVEAEGGCWHEWISIIDKKRSDYECVNCKEERWYQNVEGQETNPDFSSWSEFGRLLKIAVRTKYRHSLDIERGYAWWDGKKCDIDQIPLLIATELARIIKED